MIEMVYDYSNLVASKEINQQKLSTEFVWKNGKNNAEWIEFVLVVRKLINGTGN